MLIAIIGSIIFSTTILIIGLYLDYKNIRIIKRCREIEMLKLLRVLKQMNEEIDDRWEEIDDEEYGEHN